MIMLKLNTRVYMMSSVKIMRCFSSKARLDPFLLLEVNRQADWKTIKLSYFRLARLYHPDLNGNDERAQQKFLQVKEAYEYFERKFVPEKYANVRQSFTNKFEEEMTASESTEEFESIREKNRTRTKKDSDTNFSTTTSDINFDPSDYFKGEQLINELEKHKNISKFLFVKIAAPRSPRMVDRLQLHKVTVGKGKMFGPEDYISFTLLVILIVVFFMDRKRQYQTYSFENLENVNIYNALKPSEVVKIYEDNEISPAEQVMLSSKEHMLYKEKVTKEEMKAKVYMSMGKINDMPKLDIKKRFNSALQDSQASQTK